MLVKRYILESKRSKENACWPGTRCQSLIGVGKESIYKGGTGLAWAVKAQQDEKGIHMRGNCSNSDGPTLYLCLSRVRRTSL